MMMVQCMCHVILKDRKSSDELRDRLGVGKHKKLHIKG